MLQFEQSVQFGHAKYIFDHSEQSNPKARQNARHRERQIQKDGQEKKGAKRIMCIVICRLVNITWNSQLCIKSRDTRVHCRPFTRIRRRLIICGCVCGCVHLRIIKNTLAVPIFASVISFATENKSHIQSSTVMCVCALVLLLV